MWPTAHFAVGCLLPYQELHTRFAKTSQWLCVECAFCFVCARYDGQCFSRLLFHLQVKFKVVFHRIVLKELQQNKTCKNGGAWDLPTNQEAKPFRSAPFSGTTDSAASLHMVLHTDGVFGEPPWASNCWRVRNAVRFYTKYQMPDQLNRIGSLETTEKARMATQTAGELFGKRLNWSHTSYLKLGKLQKESSHCKNGNHKYWKKACVSTFKTWAWKRRSNYGKNPDAVKNGWMKTFCVKKTPSFKN